MARVTGPSDRRTEFPFYYCRKRQTQSTSWQVQILPSCISTITHGCGNGCVFIITQMVLNCSISFTPLDVHADLIFKKKRMNMYGKGAVYKF